MFLIQLHPQIAAQAQYALGVKVPEPIRKMAQRVQKKAFSKVGISHQAHSKFLVLQGVLSKAAKQKSIRPILERIHIEEIKRKVRIQSPAALQFIGPGDQRQKNHEQKGGM